MKKYIITVPLIVLITILLSTSKLHADEITETEVIETIETTIEEEIIEETEVSDSTNQSETEVSDEEETTETTEIEETEEITTYSTETTFYTSPDWQTFSTVGLGTNHQYCYFSESGFSQKLWVYNSVYNDKTLYVETSGYPRSLRPGESTYIECSTNAKSLKFCWYSVVDNQSVIVEGSGIAIMYATSSLENQSSFTPAPDVPPVTITPTPTDPPSDSSDTIINFEVDYTLIALTAIVAVLLLWIVML